MMQIICIGISHHIAPLEFRERFAISESQLGTAARTLTQMPGVNEAVIVSTCNRVEFYFSADEPGRARDAVEHLFQARALAGGAELFSQLGTHQGISHLFRVVCGLESMVLGETEILGQVKKSYRLAQESGATARLLNKLFQRAFHVAKEVRTETNITRGPVSVGSVAVDLAERIFGRLADCNVMILGAGETSELTARALQLRGVQTIIVANRSYERAAELAAQMNGRAMHFEEWQRNAHQVDILIGSTAAPHHVLSARQLAPIMHSRPDRPLFCIDLAVPRDIEPAVNELDGVYLYDIDSLQAIADETLDVRRQELARCEEIIGRHVSDFRTWLETDSQRAARESGRIERVEPQPSKS